MSRQEYDYPAVDKIVEKLLQLKFRGAHRITRKIAELILPKPNKPIIRNVYPNLKIKLDPQNDRGVETELFLFRRYELGTINFLEQTIKEGDIVFDIGANIGYVSIVASNLVGPKGSCIAFEAHPETYNLLIENLKINNTNNCTANNIGIGSVRGKVNIYNDTSKNRGSATFRSSTSKVSLKPIKVDVWSLDEFLEESTTPVPSLIKIDVEGWEFEVLRGAKKVLQSTNPPILIVEFSKLHHLEGGTHDELYDWLCASNRYKAYKLSAGKERRSDLIPIKSKSDIPFHDNLIFFPANRKPL